MKKQRMVVAEITGVGPFPKDMLRYDGCEPATAADKEMIESTLDGSMRALDGGRPMWTTTVHKPYKRDVRRHWTVARWNSFGCGCAPKE